MADLLHDVKASAHRMGSLEMAGVKTGQRHFLVQRCLVQRTRDLDLLCAWTPATSQSCYCRVFAPCTSPEQPQDTILIVKDATEGLVRVGDRKVENWIEVVDRGATADPSPSSLERGKFRFCKCDLFVVKVSSSESIHPSQTHNPEARENARNEFV